MLLIQMRGCLGNIYNSYVPYWPVGGLISREFAVTSQTPGCGIGKGGWGILESVSWVPAGDAGLRGIQLHGSRCKTSLGKWGSLQRLAGRFG